MYMPCIFHVYIYRSSSDFQELTLSVCRTFPRPDHVIYSYSVEGMTSWRSSSSSNNVAVPSQRAGAP